MPAIVEIDEINGARKRVGTATATTLDRLVDSAANFVTSNVQAGDQVYNVTGTSFATVVSVVSATSLEITPSIFTSGDSYRIQGTTTHNISNTNMGSADAANLVAVNNPVVPGANTFEKYQRLHVTNMSGSSLINNVKIWRTGALGGAATHVTNLRTTSYVRAPYTAPTATTSVVATQAMPTTEPASANIGVNGSLAGGITTAGGATDFIVHQIKTNVADTSGSTSLINYQYDETT